MGLARRIDDALVDVVQGMVAKVAAITGAGKDSIMRDAHLTCAIVCGVWAILGVSAFGARAMLVPAFFGATELVDAFLHDRLARGENTLDGWRRCAARASEERIRSLWTRLVRILLVILSALGFLGTQALLILAGNLSPFAGSLALIALTTYLVASTVTKYVEATQPPPPRASKTTMAQPNPATASGR